MKKLKFYLLAVSSAMLLAASLNAQVTIGSQAAPDKFSVLDLVTTDLKKGIHLPRLTTAERDALIAATAADSAAAKGLALYNTTTDCLDVWNGRQWLSMCGTVPTITVQPRAFNWKETTGPGHLEGIGGQKNTLSVLVSGFGLTYRWYEIPEAYGSVPVAAPGTNNEADYTPVLTDLGMRSYYCVISNLYGSVKSEIARVAVGCGALTTDGSWRTFMCYNLGATKTAIADQLSYDHNLYFDGYLGHAPATAAESDSAVYGSLWQWGRISDGHQRRDSENSLTDNIPAPGTYTGIDVAWELGGSEQVRSDSVSYYGRFIVNGTYFSNLGPHAPYDWNRNPTGRNTFLWRNYRYTPNDPCTHVTGVDGGDEIWRIPIQDEWVDIADNWVWRPAGTSTDGSFGTSAGYEIKPDGVTTTLFLPAAGLRDYNDGQLYCPGVYGRYWSVTAYDDFSYCLFFFRGSVLPKDYNYRAFGFSLRCIAEL